MGAGAGTFNILKYTPEKNFLWQLSEHNRFIFALSIMVALVGLIGLLTYKRGELLKEHDEKNGKKTMSILFYCSAMYVSLCVIAVCLTKTPVASKALNLALLAGLLSTVELGYCAGYNKGS